MFCFNILFNPLITKKGWFSDLQLRVYVEPLSHLLQQAGKVLYKMFLKT